jgi:hypothetical protein
MRCASGEGVPHTAGQALQHRDVRTSACAYLQEGVLYGICLISVHSGEVRRGCRPSEKIPCTLFYQTPYYSISARYEEILDASGRTEHFFVAWLGLRAAPPPFAAQGRKPTTKAM